LPELQPCEIQLEIQFRTSEFAADLCRLRLLAVAGLSCFSAESGEFDFYNLPFGLSMTLNCVIDTYLCQRRDGHH
jgi:hypothetical protein